MRPVAGCLAFVLCSIVSAQSRYVEEYPSVDSRKGLQVELVDDALSLGIRHAAINVNLSQIVDPSETATGPTWRRNGKTYHFKSLPLEHFDHQIKPLSDAGVVVNLIILAYRSPDERINRLMLHPETDPAAPNQLGAFNGTTEEGRNWFVATMEFLAERWSRPDRQFGRAVGFIIGNEVNSHWWWSNRGRVTFEDFAGDYLQVVRLAVDAVRRQTSCARVYLSLDHHWNIRYPAGDQEQAFAGRRLIDFFAVHAADLDWNLAYHPYPENLFDPRFWQDQSATDSLRSARITFKNLQVLTGYLGRPELAYHGRRRRIILSEQGFHSDPSAAGETLQAAAFCYAYRIVSQLDGIDSFILHRHIDHPREGGLNLGLRRREGSRHPKKRIYDCFQQADENDWQAAFAFALPVVGLDRWPQSDEIPPADQAYR